MKKVKLPQVENPDMEAIRCMAVEMVLNYHHHEVAIADPFMAEKVLQSYGRRLIELVGWPEGTYEYWPDEKNESG